MPATSSSPRPLPLPPSPSPSDRTLQENLAPIASTAEHPLDGLNEVLEQLEPKAENEIEEVGAMLEELASLHGEQELEEIAKKVVEGAVVSLERQRHENNAHIVVVHATMVKTVYHVRFLTRIQAKFEEELEERLNIIFNHMVDTIREFGIAYHSCWQKTYKVLFSHLHKRKLEHFSSRFQQHREDLDEMRKTMTQMQLASVFDNTEEILRRIRAVDPDVSKAEAFIDRNGGSDAVRMRQNPEFVDQVAVILHEKATLGMKETLRQGFDDLLEKHTTRYLKKLESVQDNIIASISVSQKAILGRLSEGPHELIEDPEIRAIWERDVKCRVFLTASARIGLHEYYQRQFREHRSPIAHRDAWTLDCFSRVMYHSAIGDVVDDDGSGYISASEVNDFISEQRSLAHWSKPQWFALYYRRIKHLIQEAEKSVHSLEAGRTHGSLHLVQTILGSMKPLVLVADVEDFSGTIKVPHQLRRLQEEYRAYEEAKIIANLAHFGHHLIDRPSLNAAVGDSRIELHMMPLLYILMARLQETTSTFAIARHIQDSELIAVEELATSCIAVFVAFEDRMRDLVRGWRFEGKDIDMQVDRYADGLFRKCYHETRVYEQAYDDLRGCIFGSDHRLPRNLRPFSTSRRRQASYEIVVHELAALSQRVRVLENRLSVTPKSSVSDRSSRASTPLPGVHKEVAQATPDPPLTEASDIRTTPRPRRFVCYMKQLFTGWISTFRL
ncbi:hypothetical protein C8Q77DRAFT_1214685 [Trametes polyzona]|nr:hypothetical protein C8Q77DRAFT_1214685 [Trametes polyzona]